MRSFKSDIIKVVKEKNKVCLPLLISFISMSLFSQETDLLNKTVTMDLEGVNTDSLFNSVKAHQQIDNYMYENMLIDNDAYQELQRNYILEDQKTEDLMYEDAIQDKSQNIQQQLNAIIVKKKLENAKMTQEKFERNLQIEEELYSIIVKKDLEDKKKIDSIIVKVENVETEIRNVLRGPSQYDSRVEIANLNTEDSWEIYIATAANSVGMVVDIAKLQKINNNYYRLNTNIDLKTALNVCDNTAFSSQPVVGVGTAFPIEKNIFITAAHVFEKEPSKYAIVFGFKMANKNNAIDNIIPSTGVYFVERVLKSSKDIDIVSFKVNREFSGVPLQTETGDTYKINDQVYMLGYPLGLPQKLTINAEIEENTHPQFFLTSLDSFSGNSGSPVFNYRTNKVIGVMVSGGVDFKFNGNCYEEAICTPPYCVGEKIIRLDEFLKFK
mgnify:CR=1 FL=1